MADEPLVQPGSKCLGCLSYEEGLCPILQNVIRLHGPNQFVVDCGSFIPLIREEENSSSEQGASEQ